MENSEYFDVLVGPNKCLYKLNKKILPLLDIIRIIYENMNEKEPIELD